VDRLEADNASSGKFARAVNGFLPASPPVPVARSILARGTAAALSTSMRSSRKFHSFILSISQYFKNLESSI
jgi:hypothetical protein